MKLRFVTFELLRHQRRVRRARELVRHDKAETRAAFKRFKRDKLASPGGIAACAAAGLLFERVTTDKTSSRPMARIQAAIWMARDTMALIEGLDKPSDTADSDEKVDGNSYPAAQMSQPEMATSHQAES